MAKRLYRKHSERIDFDTLKYEDQLYYLAIDDYLDTLPEHIRKLVIGTHVKNRKLSLTLDFNLLSEDELRELHDYQ